MKLPEYDNRPAPGEQMYSTDSAKSEWEDIKFPLMAIGIPLGILASLGLVALGVFRLVAN